MCSSEPLRFLPCHVWHARATFLCWRVGHCSVENSGNRCNAPLQEVFGATYEANIEDDVNRVLFGIKGDASEPPSQKPTKGLRQLFTDSMQIDIVDEIADQLSALQLLQPGSQTSAAQLLWS